MTSEKPGTIAARRWAGVQVHENLAPGLLFVEATGPGVQHAEVSTWGATRVRFTATQLREIAADFLERAEHLDNAAGRNRKTPAWHIREGERALAQAKQHPETPDADVHALIASAHFQAAQALRGHLQVVNHHHSTEPSGKDTA